MFCISILRRDENEKKNSVDSGNDHDRFLHRGGYSESDGLNSETEWDYDQPDLQQQESEDNMATGDKLVNLDDLKVSHDKNQGDISDARNIININVDDIDDIIGNKKIASGTVTATVGRFVKATMADGITLENGKTYEVTLIPDHIYDVDGYGYVVDSSNNNISVSGSVKDQKQIKWTFTVSQNYTNVSIKTAWNVAGTYTVSCILKEYAQNNVEQSIHYISSGSAENANTYRDTGFYIINDNGLTNGFPDAGGVLIVHTGKDNHYQTYQVFVSYFDEKIYARNEKGNGVWSDWSPSGIWTFSNTSETDLNNITNSGYYFISGTFSNRPIADNGTLIVFKKDSSPNYNTYQLFIDYTDHNLYIRGKQGASTWSAWKCTEPTFVSKNIVWFGDSISSLKPLPEDTAEHISAKAISCAIPGARMDKATASNWKYENVGFCNLMKCMNDNDYSSIDEAVAQFIEDDPTWAYESHMTAFKNLDWSKVDSAVVLYGTNDYWDGVVTVEQFKADITTAFSQLITNHPLVRIYIITPMFRTDYATLNDQGVSLLAYVDAIKEVAQSLNIPCLDLFHESRINQYNATQYLNNDGLHQNTHGERLLAQRIAKFIYGN